MIFLQKVQIINGNGKFLGLCEVEFYRRHTRNYSACHPSAIIEACIENFDNDLRVHLPFKADPHLLQNLSSLPVGFPQLSQKFEGDFILAFAS